MAKAISEKRVTKAAKEVQRAGTGCNMDHMDKHFKFRLHPLRNIELLITTLDLIVFFQETIYLD